METYKSGFGGQSKLSKMSKSDKEDFYWFLTSVASGVSSKAGENKRKKSYRESVTITDEAFAFMVLQHHRQKWSPETEEDKKKRVTGGDKEKSMAYFVETTKFLKKWREENDAKYKVGEEWLEKQRKEDEDQNNKNAEGEDGDNSDEEEEARNARNEIQNSINPFLKAVV